MLQILAIRTPIGTAVCCSPSEFQTHITTPQGWPVLDDHCLAIFFVESQMNHGIAVKKNSKDLPGRDKGRFSFAKLKEGCAPARRFPFAAITPVVSALVCDSVTNRGGDACAVYSCDIQHGP